MKFKKNTSDNAKKYIMAGRAVLFSSKSIPVIRHMITGGKTLALGAAPFIATTLVHLEAKMGPIKDRRDELHIVMHLCQDVADIAHELHDPAAKNAPKAAAQIFAATARVLAGQHPETGQPVKPPPMQGMQQPRPGVAPPPQQPAPLAQMGG